MIIVKHHTLCTFEFDMVGVNTSFKALDEYVKEWYIKIKFFEY
jgi:hypothetical protein